MAATSSPAGSLCPGAAVVRACIVPPRPPAASSCVLQLRAAPARRAHLIRAAVAARPSSSSPVLRRASSSETSAAWNDDVDEVDYDLVVVPPWGPSEELLREFSVTDFSQAAIRERFRRESAEARAAVVAAVAGVFRPLRDNFNDVLNLEYVHVDTEEFHIGMPFGALMTCIGMYQLCKYAPSMCLDVALPYAFYKLSVLAADVRRRGFSPDLIIRIKLAIVVAMTMKDIRKDIVPLDYIRLPVYFMYTLSVLWDLTGYKKYAKYALPIIMDDVKTLFQNLQSMMVKRDGEPLQSFSEPNNSDGVKQDGEPMQFVSESDGEPLQSFSEPNNPNSVKQDGEPLQFVSESDGEPTKSFSEPDNSNNVTRDGEPLQFVSESDGEPLQFFSELNNSNGVKQDGEPLQFVPEPNNSNSVKQED